jgi:5-methylcytosine-specific restriction enzyme A
MATYLLAWNPKRWQWDDLEELSSVVKMGRPVLMRWSCGRNQRLKEGDRVFIIRLGQEPRGIFSSGSIVKGSFEDAHWDEERATTGQKSFFVQVQLNALLNPDIDVILPRELLKAPPLADMHWDTQMSGVRVPDQVAEQLERLWVQFTSTIDFTLPEEVTENGEMYEGASRRILVNAYERNSEAREICIAHYGAICYICGFDFEAVYGEIGKGYIHVHHLQQLSEIGDEYLVDPVRDLRPVCPNCHAIIHQRKSAYSIEEVRLFLQEAMC